MKKVYWIHGKQGSGKTELAKMIAGPDAAIISSSYTDEGKRRMLQNAKAAIFEDFVEEQCSKAELIRSCQLQTTTCKGVVGSKDTVTQVIDLDVLVFVSTDPPEDESILRSVYVVHLKSPVE
jgi:ABC-type molybdenum transport system ATPase subunit/photorepair protein PhrA